MKYGNLGEISSIKEMTRMGYEVYTPFDNSSYDFLCVNRSGKVLKVEVKSCYNKNNGKYTVQLKKVRSNKTENKIYNFNKDFVDILCLYLVEDDITLCLSTSNFPYRSAVVVDPFNLNKFKPYLINYDSLVV